MADKFKMSSKKLIQPKINGYDFEPVLSRSWSLLDPFLKFPNILLKKFINEEKKRMYKKELAYGCSYKPLLIYDVTVKFSKLNEKFCIVCFILIIVSQIYLMNCEIHDLKKIAICSQCKCLLCVQCIFDLHKTHLHQIVLIKTLVILANSMKEFLTFDSVYFQDEDKHDYYLKQKKQYLQMFEILKKGEDLYQLEWLIKVLEKQILHQWIFLINSNNKLEKKTKINQKEELAYKLLKSDDATYIYLKQYDLYYLIKHYGNNQEAFQIQKLALMKLMKENCFFDIKDDQIQNDKQYNQIEQDEYFIISQGRNYYLIREYEACIQFMNNYQYIDEARIYIALSNLCLQNYDVAYQQLEEFKLKGKNIDLIELFQGIDQLNSRDLILDQRDIYQFPFIISLSKIKKLQQCYQFLYQKYPCKIFFNLFCHYLFEAKEKEKIQILCNEVIQTDPQNYNAWMYKFFTQFESTGIFELQEISHKLILIEPLNIIGYIFQGACLIFQNKFQELNGLCGALKMKFQKSNLLYLLECVNLMLKKKYNKALQLIGYQIEVRYFFVKIFILLKLKNLPLIYDIIFMHFKNENCDYFILDFICIEINKIGFHEEAINLLEGYVDDDKKEGKFFYHILLGKLLVDQGIKFNDLEIIKQGLDELTNFTYDEPSLPYLPYYKGEGQALLKLNRFDEAVENFEYAYRNKKLLSDVLKTILHETLIVHKFIQGNFKDVQILLKEQKLLTPELSIIIEGLLFWLSGNYDQSILLLKQISSEFPYVFFVIIQIYGEQNKISEADEILQKLEQSFPQFNLFCHKYTLISSGPYSQYIINNKEKFDLFQNQKFYAIKLLAVYFEQIYIPPQPFLDEQSWAQIMLPIIERENKHYYKSEIYKIIENYIHI